MINGINTKVNSWGNIVSSCLEDCKTMLHSLFYKQLFYSVAAGWDLILNNSSHILKGKINIVNEGLSE